MNIREAIEAIKPGEMWARPVTWKGRGEAITSYCDHRLAVVPSATGGAPWYPSVSDLTSDWEAIDPDEVLDERVL